MNRQRSSLETLEVLNPVGKSEVSETGASRVVDLHGKTICEVSNGAFRVEETFPVIRELLKTRFPDAKFVPYTEFPTCFPCPDNIASLLKERGCDAAIVGNGG